MKHFVYFDKDFIDSYLSQINGGLITSLQEEVSDLIEKSKSETLIPEVNTTEGNVSAAGFAGLKRSETEPYLQESNTAKQVESMKDLVSKIVHDNAFDSLVSHLREEDLLKDSCTSESFESGEYLYLNDCFDILDLSHLTSIFDDDFNVLFEAAEKESFESQITSMNRESRRANRDEIKNKQKEIDKTVEEMDFSVRLIKFMSKILPSDTFIVYKDYLIPLVRENFRENPKSIRFKYTEKAHIVGKVTGNMKDLIRRNPSNGLGDILNILDDVALSMLDTILPNENLKVLYPIALYFE